VAYDRNSSIDAVSDMSLGTIVAFTKNDDVYVLKVQDGIVVPVELAIFSARWENNAIVLTWSTASETNNYGFEVQRWHDDAADNNGSWETLSFIPGQGTTSLRHNYRFSDSSADAIHENRYRLKMIQTDGTYTFSAALTVAGAYRNYRFKLMQNYPNPFNPATVIPFELPVKTSVELQVFDIRGRLVYMRRDMLGPGLHQIPINLSDLPAGVYIYRIRAGAFQEEKKMIYVK
jgi:hypothetical protein